MRHSTENEGAKRAPYALPRGSPALQFEVGGGVRRLALTAIAVLIVLIPLGFLVGRYTSPEASLSREELGSLSQLELLWAKTVARGPSQDLVEQYIAFLDIVEVHGSDPVLWFGVERLAREALLARTPETRRLRDRLLVTIRNGTPPDDYRQILPPQE